MRQGNRPSLSCWMALGGVGWNYGEMVTKKVTVNEGGAIRPCLHQVRSGLTLLRGLSYNQVDLHAGPQHSFSEFKAPALDA